MRRSLRLAVVWCLLLSGQGQAQSDQTRTPEFLYQLAQEHLQAGREAEAIHELHELLVLDPGHLQAQQALTMLEQEHTITRARVIDETLNRIQHSQASAREEAIARTLQQTHALPAEPALPAHAAPPQEPLADRMTLPSVPFQGLERVVRPVEKTRREVLAAPTRAGFKKFYKEGIGFEPVRGLGFSGRTEIFAEPFPVDGLIIDTKVLNFSELSQFRRSILPLFTRSGAGRVVLDPAPESLPRLTYEFDARQTLHQFQTKFAFKDINLETHAVNALYSFPEIPFFGVLTVNPWYKRVLQSSDHDLGAHEHRNEMVVNLSLQQTNNIEYFFQLDMYQANKTRTVGGSKLKLFKGQVRLRFPELRLFAIPSFEYSETTFDPGDDEYIKRDIFVDWGFDITNRLRASSKQQVVSSRLSQAGKIPSNPTAEVFNWTNTLSYELFKDFDVSIGFDYSHGFGYSNYNNVGIRAEMELFKAGLIRSKLGYEWISYYNIGEDLSLVFWKFFLFQ